MKITPTKSAQKLMLDGTLALAKVEASGIKIDTDYLNKTIKETDKKLELLKRKLQRDENAKVWKRRFGSKTNFGSYQQLGTILFSCLGLEPIATTAIEGRPKTDASALSEIDLPIVKTFLKIKKLEKMSSTYLQGIARETVYGFLHPVFNLHTTQTYRGSADSPNFQNIPIRDEVIGKIIRKAFIPRKGRTLIEIDYGGLEVKIAACYHKDPTMLDYLNDDTKDMHRDMASECFLLPSNKVNKKVRYCGKNMFVFPQFYGDWFIDCAKHLWEALDAHKLTVDVSGKERPLKKWLYKKGIYELGSLDARDDIEEGTFVNHIRKVEKRFWEDRFPVYANWKKRWYNSYRKHGCFKTKTGFVCSGFMKRNEAINYPVQGSAFHCLLWSLIMIQKEIERRGLKTLIVGNIHDSIVLDVPENEVTEVLEMCKEIMTERIKESWKWIITPLEIEAEGSPISWADKEVMEI